MIPFSAVAGFVTPMLVDDVSSGDPDRAGRAYAVNVLGSILGPLLAGFFLLPWFGEHWALCVTALPLFAAGLIIAGAASRRVKYLCVAAMAASVALVLSTAAYDAKFARRVTLRDYTATVIATGEGMDRRLLVNGTGMTTLTTITKIMAHLPLSLLPMRPERGLVICFGMGTTFRSMMSWGLDTTAAELVPSVPKVLSYFHADGPRLLDSPRAHIIIDDGRRYLDRSRDLFDVITVDPPPPVQTPTSGLLYSVEFYSIVRPHLRPGGIVQVWFPDGDAATWTAIAKALRNSFPFVRVYRDFSSPGAYFLASMSPFGAATAANLPQQLPPAAAADLVEWLPATKPAEVLDAVLTREVPLDNIIESAGSTPPMTDNRPINEYYVLRSIQ